MTGPMSRGTAGPDPPSCCLRGSQGSGEGQAGPENAHALGSQGPQLGPPLLTPAVLHTVSAFLSLQRCPCPLSSLVTTSLVLFQMDLDEDTAERFYQNLLKLEERVRATIQNTDPQS